MVSHYKLRTNALAHLISNLPRGLEAPTIVVAEVGSVIPIPEINNPADPDSLILYTHIL